MSITLAPKDIPTDLLERATLRKALKVYIRYCDKRITESSKQSTRDQYLDDEARARDLLVRLDPEVSP